MLKNLFFLMVLLYPVFVEGQTSQQIDSVKKVLQNHPTDSNQVFSLIYLADAYRLNKADTSLIIGQAALKLSEQLHYDKGIFWSQVAVAKSLHILGNYSLELDYALKAYPLSKKLNDVYAIGWANGILGDCYFNLGEYETCLSYYRKILRRAEQQKLIDLASMYYNLVPVYNRLHRYDSALILARKGYTMVRQNPILNNPREDNNSERSFMYRFLGEAFASNQMFDSALLYFRKGLLFSQGEDVKLNKIEVYNGIGQAYQQLGNVDSAIWYLSKIFAGRSSTYPAGFLTAANRMADLYQQKNIADSTLKYLRTAIAIKDSLFNREKTIAVQNILFREQEKQRELEAATTALQNRFRMYAVVALAVIIFIAGFVIIRNQRIRQLQRIRDRIADDLHDDIGSALSSISIMSELAKSKSADALPLLTSIRESASTVQENMSDIVWNIKSESDRFEHVLLRMNQFASSILDSKNITLEFVSDDSLASAKLTMEQRKNLYLFFKEVVNNAVKHSQAGKVMVSITSDRNNMDMRISDNGVGFDTSRSSNGNGLYSLQRRANELNASLKIISRLKEGTTVQLSFKIT